MCKIGKIHPWRMKGHASAAWHKYLADSKCLRYMPNELVEQHPEVHLGIDDYDFDYDVGYDYIYTEAKLLSSDLHDDEYELATAIAEVTDYPVPIDRLIV